MGLRFLHGVIVLFIVYDLELLTFDLWLWPACTASARPQRPPTKVSANHWSSSRGDQEVEGRSGRRRLRH